MRNINSIEKIPDRSILVTIIVRSLYKNISNQEGTEVVETTLKRATIRTRIISTLSMSKFFNMDWNYGPANEI